MSERFEGDPIRQALARKIARKIDGGDAIDDMALLEVGESAVAFELKLSSHLDAINAKWQEQQDEMFNKKISDKSDRWLAAQRIYDIQVRAIERRMDTTSRMGLKP